MSKDKQSGERKRENTQFEERRGKKQKQCVIGEKTVDH